MRIPTMLETLYQLANFAPQPPLYFGPLAHSIAHRKYFYNIHIHTVDYHMDGNKQTTTSYLRPVYEIGF